MNQNEQLEQRIERVTEGISAKIDKIDESIRVKYQKLLTKIQKRKQRSQRGNVGFEEQKDSLIVIKQFADDVELESCSSEDFSDKFDSSTSSKNRRRNNADDLSKCNNTDCVSIEEQLRETRAKLEVANYRIKQLESQQRASHFGLMAK